MPDQQEKSHTLTNDQNFKNLILDYPHQSLEFFAADEAGDITPDVRITPVRQEQLKDRLGDHFHELDTPVAGRETQGASVSRQILIDSKFSTVICAPVYTGYDGLSSQVKIGIEQGIKYFSSIHCNGEKKF